MSKTVSIQPPPPVNGRAPLRLEPTPFDVRECSRCSNLLLSAIERLSGRCQQCVDEFKAQRGPAIVGTETDGAA